MLGPKRLGEELFLSAHPWPALPIPAPTFQANTHETEAHTHTGETKVQPGLCSKGPGRSVPRSNGKEP